MRGRQYFPRVRAAISAIGALRSGRRDGGAPVASATVPRDAIMPHDSLRAARQEVERSVASRLDPVQSRSPVWPRTSQVVIQQQGYRRNEVVRRCFDVIVEAATQAIPELVAEDDRAKAPDKMVQEFRNLLRCPAGPESDLTGSDLWVRFWLDVLGTGNGMFEMVPGQGAEFPVRLWRMDPARTAIIPSEETRIEAYVVRLGGQLFEIPTDRVLHFRTWDPISDFWGIPRLYSALRSLATDSDLIDMMKVTFQNLGVPPVVLEYPLANILEGIQAGALTSMQPPDDVVEQASDRWQDKYSGKNRGKAAVAWGFTVKLLGLDFQKLAIGELVATTERRILMAHGVNPLLVGQSGTEQQRGHNFREVKDFFYGQVIAFLIRQLDDVMSARLAPKFGEGLVVRSRTDQIAAVRDAKLRRGGEAAEIFRSGLLKRHSCQRLIGEPTDGEDIFYPDVYGPATQPAATGEKVDE